MKQLTKFCLPALGASILLAGCAGAPKALPLAPDVDLSIVAESERQWTGVAVSREGRVFLNFPRWSDDVPVSVVELKEDGSLAPYPDGLWNDWAPGKPAAAHFVCVQSVHVDDKDRLWILDPASPSFSGVLPNGAKLLEVDLDRDRVVRTYLFPDAVAPSNSYLNDLRVDTLREVAYITDSGAGAIVVLDLKTGQSWRLLAGHPSVMAEDVVLTIGGREWRRPDGAVPQVHADGLALSPDNEYLFYQALSGRTLHRVRTSYLLDRSLSAEQVAAGVQEWAEVGASDAIISDALGNIYLSSLEHDAIRRLTPGKQIEVVAQSPQIAWPDSFAFGRDGSLWFTTAQIHRGPNPPEPCRLWRLSAPKK